jgi:cation:H+ antiporter
MIWLIIKFSLAIVILIWSSQLLIRVLGHLTRYFQVSFFAAGVVFVAISTTIPELFLGIDAALQGLPTLSLGTVLGSNIANIALVLGVALLVVRKLRPSQSVKSKDAGWALAGIVAPLVLLIDGYLSKIDGLILLLIFISYVYSIFLSRQRLTKNFKKINKRKLVINIIKFAVGIIGLLIASKYVVEYGSALAFSFQIPLIAIGVTVYALSTSLPEMVFVAGALSKGKEGLALGDLIGALVVNSTLVLGLTALIAPITIIDFDSFLLASGFLLLLSVLLFTVVKRKWIISWPIGIILIVSYIIFLIVELI